MKGRILTGSTNKHGRRHLGNDLWNRGLGTTIINCYPKIAYLSKYNF